MRTSRFQTKNMIVSYLVSFDVYIIFRVLIWLLLKVDIIGCYIWISDLDDTIYPLTSGLSKEVTKNIQGIPCIIVCFFPFRQIN